MSAETSPVETDALELVRAAFALAREGNELALQSLLDRGVPPNVRNEKGDSLLMLASYHGHVNASILLLLRGADPELANDRGQTPLAGAAFKGDPEIATVLLDHGAAPDGAGPDGKTPLMFAAMFDRPVLIDLLLSRGADVARTDATGNSAFSLACAMGAEGALAALERYRKT
jgi:ankyrin repeat protein